MRILYVSHLHPPENAPLDNMGGMQRVSMQLIDELSTREDIEIKTIIQHSPWKGIEVKTAFFLTKLVFKLPKIVKEFKPDVILFSSMVTASLAKFCRNKIDVPMVTINHGHDVKLSIGIYQNFVPKVFEALDGVISVSEATRQECIKRGMSPEKGVALPNGFDMSDFKDVPDKAEGRKEIEEAFSVDLSGKSLLLTVGRQVKRKGHDWFITEVLPKIKSEVVYLVIGAGPEHDRLKEIVNTSNLQDKVLMVGKQPDEVLKNAYAGADIFIMPNIPIPGDMEGFGIVLLEANLAGTPAVAADLEGIKDVIENGKNGFKIAVRDAENFSGQIDSLIENDLEEMSTSSRKYVLENFTWNKVAQQYISYLKEIVENKKTLD
ncbi:glycosyltransferase family 4 protein [Balneola sp. EhC07]|uniref:glycosyltransferase family 4 protein n=1 Tax=Balneola sp. EhC07 TaxID=1849360 RepID=UPI001F453D15|nr:glycosyltransferase family 4 protein [Balneola sp. EhC07]